MIAETARPKFSFGAVQLNPKITCVGNVVRGTIYNNIEFRLYLYTNYKHDKLISDHQRQYNNVSLTDDRKNVHSSYPIIKSFKIANDKKYHS